MKWVQVWDKPTRIFHWVLALSIAGALLTALWENLLEAHVLLGKLAVSGVIFRLGWGLLGNRFARFSQFLKSPRKLKAYAKSLLAGSMARTLGHNPLAGWVMLGMIILPLLIGITGLMGLGGQENIGPTAAWFGFELGRVAVWLHLWSAYLLLALIGMHLVGIALHVLMHRENVVASMLHGWKRLGHGNDEVSEKKTPPWLIPARKGLAGVMVAVVLGLFAGLPFVYHSPPTLRALKMEGGKGSNNNVGFTGFASSAIAATTETAEVAAAAKTDKPMPQENTMAGTHTQSKQGETERIWWAECGACHFAFHPSNLPGASWQVMFASLEDHFGEVASLDPETEKSLLAHALANRGETTRTEAARYLMASAAGGNPQRITELDYWKARHADIDETVFSRKSIRKNFNCGACHLYADYGSFEDAHISIPR